MNRPIHGCMHHPRIEHPEYAAFTTVRSRNSELWLANNRAVERAALGYIAKYSNKYQVILYALALEGSHVHTCSQYPLSNRAQFCRDVNSSIARAVARLTPEYPGGRLWARRYSSEVVPSHEDIERQFFYTVLQPVKDRLVDRLSDYPFYSCFNDAISGNVRRFKIVNWTSFNERRRWNPNERIADHVETFELRFKRLPGYELLSPREYKQMMLKKLEEHRRRILTETTTPALGRMALLRVKPGTKAKNPKQSARTEFRPRILCSCPELRRYMYDWYFDHFYRFKLASLRYRTGELTVRFPIGMYRPSATRPEIDTG